jgi:hypothetical protein
VHTRRRSSLLTGGRARRDRATRRSASSAAGRAGWAGGAGQSSLARDSGRRGQAAAEVVDEVGAGDVDLALARAGPGAADKAPELGDEDEALLHHEADPQEEHAVGHLRQRAVAAARTASLEPKW